MSDAEDECIHGLTPASCTICLHGLTKPPGPAVPIATFSARYNGECRGCGFPINVGDTIHHLSDGSYVHADCT